MKRHAGGFTHEAPHRGRTDVWLTPPAIVDALGPFDCDPCAADPRPFNIGRLQNLTWKENGLLTPWRGFAFVNPPYGPQTARWLQRTAEHSDGAIALVFARTDTRAFHRAIQVCSCALFLADRVAFLVGAYPFPARSGTGAASLLLGYGELARRRLANCGLRGAYFQADAVSRRWTYHNTPPSSKTHPGALFR